MWSLDSWLAGVTEEEVREAWISEVGLGSLLEFCVEGPACRFRCTGHLAPCPLKRDCGAGSSTLPSGLDPHSAQSRSPAPLHQGTPGTREQGVVEPCCGLRAATSIGLARPGVRARAKYGGAGASLRCAGFLLLYFLITGPTGTQDTLGGTTTPQLLCSRGLRGCGSLEKEACVAVGARVGAVGTGHGMDNGQRPAGDMDKTTTVVSSDEEEQITKNRRVHTTSGSEMEAEETRSAFFTGGTTASFKPFRKRPLRRESEGSSSGGSAKSSLVKRGRGEDGDSDRARDEEAAAMAARRVEAAISSVKTLPASSLAKEMERALGVIVEVATNSRNLKGGWVRALKTSAALLGEAKDVLLQRTSGKEAEILQARLEEEKRKNALLQQELGMLRDGQARLRADLDNLSSPRATRTDREEGEFRVSLMREIGAMMDAKLQGIEGRLMPERRLRPPLASDKTQAPPTRTPAPATTSSEARRPGAADNGTKAKKAKVKDTTTRPLPLPPPSREETWTEVTKKKKKGKKAQETRRTQTRQQPNTGRKQSRPKGQAREASRRPPPKTKLKTPRSAAVVITLSDDAAAKGVTYASILKEAQAKVDLKETIGIESVKFRRAVTGATILQIPGAGNDPKADLLADKLREAVGGDCIRISRPVKLIDMRVTDLADCVTAEDLANAIVSKMECAAAQVKHTTSRRQQQESRASMTLSGGRTSKPGAMDTPVTGLRLLRKDWALEV
ncbi:unnamed protein product [Danaus chrysippus]|uniref:(African queen) hypothetical protein n=1 Tax=Danaus chrysippus TaxID=151541 RepID=A0A8J2ME50_9NEOP|nr:unnamed protein product [Danaus chrysippus]